MDGDTVAVWIYTRPEQVAQLLNITADKLWTYDKFHKSPFTPKDETLFGLYMATVKKAVPTGEKMHKPFKNLKEADEAFERHELKVNVECIIDNKRTTYGRAKLSQICNIDVEQFLKNFEFYDKKVPTYKKPTKVNGESSEHYQKRVDKAKEKYEKALKEYNDLEKYKQERHYIEMNGLGIRTIPKFILIMGTHPNKVQEYLEMQKFAVRIATMVGLGTVPYENLVKDIKQEDIDKIINKKYDSEGKSFDDMRAEAMQRKEDLRKLFEDEINKQIIVLPESNIREVQNSIGKLNTKKLITVYGPAINGNDLNDLTSTVGDSLFEGTSEMTYQSMAEHDRETLKIKQDI